jgi:hypothetical protein
MAQQQRSKRDQKHEGDDAVATYEKELAGYLQQRIKPGLNSGAIPLLARSIAKDIAHRERPNGASAESGADDEPSAETDEEPTGEAADEPNAEADDEPTGEADDDEPTGEADDDEPTGEADDDEPTGEAGEDADDEADDEPSAEADGEPSDDGEATSDFEADMHDLQAELGEDWILRFSVQGEAAWLTAEKEDGSQRVEAPTAAVISEAVALLNEGGGRDT